MTKLETHLLQTLRTVAQEISNGRSSAASSAAYSALKAAAREHYTGHNSVGGLQKHSTGDDYPWTVIAVGDLQPVEWQAYNCNTGRRGERRSVISQAQSDVIGYRSVDRLAVAIRNDNIRVWGSQA